MPKSRTKSKSKKEKPSSQTKSEDPQKTALREAREKATDASASLVSLIKRSQESQASQGDNVPSVFDRSIMSQKLNLGRKKHEVYENDDSSRTRTQKDDMYLERIRKNAMPYATTLTRQAFSNLSKSIDEYPKNVPTWAEAMSTYDSDAANELGSKIAGSVQYRIDDSLRELLEEFEERELTQGARNVELTIEPKFWAEEGEGDDGGSLFARYSFKLPWKDKRGPCTKTGDSAAFDLESGELSEDVTREEEKAIAKAFSSKAAFPEDKKYEHRQEEMLWKCTKLDKDAAEEAIKALASLHSAASSIKPQYWQSQFGDTASAIATTLKKTDLWSTLGLIDRADRQAKAEEAAIKSGEKYTAPKNPVNQHALGKARTALRSQTTDLPSLLSSVMPSLTASFDSVKQSAVKDKKTARSKDYSKPRDRSREREYSEEEDEGYGSATSTGSRKSRSPSKSGRSSKAGRTSDQWESGTSRYGQQRTMSQSGSKRARSGSSKTRGRDLNRSDRFTDDEYSDDEYSKPSRKKKNKSRKAPKTEKSSRRASKSGHSQGDGYSARSSSKSRGHSKTRERSRDFDESEEGFEDEGYSDRSPSRTSRRSESSRSSRGNSDYERFRDDGHSKRSQSGSRGASDTRRRSQTSYGDRRSGSRHWGDDDDE